MSQRSVVGLALLTALLAIGCGIAKTDSNRREDASEKSRLDATIEMYNEVIRLDPKNAIAHYSRGATWLQKGDLEAAIKDLTESTRLDPKNKIAFAMRGVAWMDKGDFNAAIKDCTEVIRLDPKDPVAYHNRGLAWLKKGDFDAAIEDLNEAIREEPETAWAAYFIRGTAWDAKVNFNAAINDFTESIRLNPRASDAYNDLAWLLATCLDDKYRNGTKAVEFATKACEVSDRNKSQYIGTLAAAYAETGDWKNAIKRQAEAIEMTNNEGEKQEGRERLELYKLKHPYRETRQNLKSD